MIDSSATVGSSWLVIERLVHGVGAYYMGIVSCRLLGYMGLFAARVWGTQERK